MKHTFVLIALSFTFFQCKKPEDRNCFKFAGEDASITISLNEFRYLDCLGNYNLNLIQDTVNKMVVSGGENLIHRIQFKERNDSLYITNENSCRFLRSYDKEVTLDLHYKDLDYFKYDGGDTVKFINTLETSYFRYRMRDGGGTVYLDIDTDYADINLESGSGDIHLKGSSFYSRLFLNSTGYIFADTFTVNELDVLNHGSGKLYCNADSSEFFASIFHIGNIYYQGNPLSTTVEKIGSGELIKINP